MKRYLTKTMPAAFVFLAVGILSSGVAKSDEIRELGVCAGIVMAASQDLNGYLPRTGGDARRTIQELAAHLEGNANLLFMMAAELLVESGVDENDAEEIRSRIFPLVSEGGREIRRLIDGQPLRLLEETRARQVTMDCLAKNR